MKYVNWDSMSLSLSTFLVSSSLSFLPSTPVCKYSPSSRWEQAFPFRRFEGGFSPVSLWKCSPPETPAGRGFWGQIYTEAIVCLPIKPVNGGYIVLSDGFLKWASPGKTRPDIKTDLLMRTIHIPPPPPPRKQFYIPRKHCAPFKVINAALTVTTDVIYKLDLLNLFVVETTRSISGYLQIL